MSVRENTASRGLTLQLLHSIGTCEPAIADPMARFGIEPGRAFQSRSVETHHGRRTETAKAASGELDIRDIGL